MRTGRRTGTGCECTPTAAPTAVPTPVVYLVMASLQLEGVTVAQFDEGFQQAFIATLATKLGVAQDRVSITSISRRAVTVAFTVETASAEAGQEHAAALDAFLADGSSEGFITSLNAELAAAGVEAEVTSSAVADLTLTLTLGDLQRGGRPNPSANPR